MPLSRRGPGPVFVYESIVATRRWQLYALRFLFVLGLSAQLWPWAGILTGSMSQFAGPNAGGLTMRQLAALGAVLLLRDRHGSARPRALGCAGRDCRIDLPGSCSGYAHPHVRAPI